MHPTSGYKLANTSDMARLREARWATRASVEWGGKVPFGVSVVAHAVLLVAGGLAFSDSPSKDGLPLSEMTWEAPVLVEPEETRSEVVEEPAPQEPLAERPRPELLADEIAEIEDWDEELLADRKPTSLQPDVPSSFVDEPVDRPDPLEVPVSTPPTTRPVAESEPAVEPVPVRPEPTISDVVLARPNAHLRSLRRIQRVAVRKGWVGELSVLVRVSAEGVVLSATVTRSSGEARLDEIVRDAVQGWSFIPATRDGRPADCSLTIPFRF